MPTRVLIAQTVFLALVLGIMGCGGPKPPDFPALIEVKGVVKKGKEAVSGGEVQFTPDMILPFSISSPVGTDGTFTLVTKRTTIKAGESKPGAPAGKYYVSYKYPEGNPGGTINFATPVTPKAGEDVVLDLAKAAPKDTKKGGTGDPKKK